MAVAVVVVVSAHVRAMADLSGRRRLVPVVVHVPALHTEIILLEEVEVSSLGAGAGAGVGAGVSLADSPVCLTRTRDSFSGTFFSATDESADSPPVEDRRESSTAVLAVDARRRSPSAACADFGSSTEADLASSRSIRRWTDVLSSRGSVAASSEAGSGRPPKPVGFLLPELRRRVASALRVRISPGMREWTVEV